MSRERVDLVEHHPAFCSVERAGIGYFWPDEEMESAPPSVAKDRGLHLARPSAPQPVPLAQAALRWLRMRSFIWPTIRSAQRFHAVSAGRGL